MLAAARQGEWSAAFIPGGQIVADPTRMAHGVLTGLGFLCAGVIFREGPTVHGLTTAASLWITAALGLLYGMGMYWLAVAGALSTLVVLALFRVFHWIFPEQTTAVVKVHGRAFGLFDAAAFRKLLDAEGYGSSPVAQRVWSNGGRLSLVTTVRLRAPEDAERLGARLAALPGLERYEIVPAEA